MKPFTKSPSETNTKHAEASSRNGRQCRYERFNFRFGIVSLAAGLVASAYIIPTYALDQNADTTSVAAQDLRTQWDGKSTVAKDVDAESESSGDDARPEIAVVNAGIEAAASDDAVTTTSSSASAVPGNVAVATVTEKKAPTVPMPVAVVKAIVPKPVEVKAQAEPEIKPADAGVGGPVETSTAVAPAPKANVVPTAATAPKAVTSGSVVWPVGSNPKISSPYGYRNAPCSGCSTNHKGVDMVPGSGTPVVSVADGVVSQSGVQGSYGVIVVVDHVVGGVKVSTAYAHLQSGSNISVGQKVSAGQQIGRVGSTGQSTGAHLHFEVRIGGVFVDPMVWLRANAS